MITMVFMKAATLSNEIRLEKEAWEKIVTEHPVLVFENSSMKCFIASGVVISCSV